mmetsp:Transcript_34644/g.87085  ORF Transcript_34644/g.87085 Transcript_34644/m.87085 type:complete len:212 (-) Transcript_34644:46-681(-)
MMLHVTGSTVTVAGCDQLLFVILRVDNGTSKHLNGFFIVGHTVCVGTELLRSSSTREFVTVRILHIVQQLHSSGGLSMDTLEIVVGADPKSLVKEVHALFVAVQTTETDSSAIITLDPLWVQFDALTTILKGSVKVVQSDVGSGAVGVERMIVRVQTDGLGVPFNGLFVLLGGEEFVTGVLCSECFWRCHLNWIVELELNELERRVVWDQK